jgi:mycofactocin system transcriptional regulator
VNNPRPAGRPPVTSRDAIEAAAFELFQTNGFEATTVDDIAAAAEIGRRTFFRYFASKNDIVWGDWDAALTMMRARLAAADESSSVLEVLRDEVVEYNRLTPDAEASHRRRMDLILHVPALQAHSTLRYAQWREVIAEFVARRRGEAVDDLRPQLFGHVALGAAVTAYEQWLSDSSAELTELLDAALTALGGLDQD